MQNFYQLLSVDPAATPEEIKRAFRAEIARYHPDKVQHLGKEFQEMAAGRAASLTEAYRTLMNPELRAEYDRLHVGVAAAVPAGGGSPSTPSPSAPSSTPPPQPERAAHREPQPPPSYSPERAPGARFASERRDRDDFVRKATLDRFRQALLAEGGQVEELPARGFDLDVAVRTKKLFTKEETRRYAVKVLRQVDRAAVQDAWGAAQKAAAPIHVFLMGNNVAPVKELADAIAELRKKSRGQSGILLIPVDVRDWSAHIPADAPAACRNLIKRLREAGH